MFNAIIRDALDAQHAVVDTAGSREAQVRAARLALIATMSSVECSFKAP